VPSFKFRGSVHKVNRPGLRHTLVHPVDLEALQLIADAECFLTYRGKFLTLAFGWDGHNFSKRNPVVV
jgi:hypothetical protein